MSKPAADLVLDELERVHRRYELATDREEPLGTHEENQAAIRQCHPQLVLLIRLLREIGLSHKHVERVRRILESSTFVIENVKLSEFARTLTPAV